MSLKTRIQRLDVRHGPPPIFEVWFQDMEGSDAYTRDGLTLTGAELDAHIRRCPDDAVVMVVRYRNESVA